MTQEDKELLLKDLCARLPYNVLVLNKDGDVESFTWQELKEFEEGYIIKPYLRPMSSMTEEEYKIYHELIGGMFGTGILINLPILEDFLNKNHFDYRGLIEKGLVLEAKEGMYE